MVKCENNWKSLVQFIYTHPSKTHYLYGNKIALINSKKLLVKFMFFKQNPQIFLKCKFYFKIMNRICGGNAKFYSSKQLFSRIFLQLMLTIGFWFWLQCICYLTWRKSGKEETHITGLFYCTSEMIQMPLVSWVGKQ